MVKSVRFLYIELSVQRGTFIIIEQNFQVNARCSCRERNKKLLACDWFGYPDGLFSATNYEARNVAIEIELKKGCSSKGKKAYLIR
jgi:hypothetical protein